jgi:TIR domain-containing protein
MPDIFLSYSRTDAERVRPIAEALAARGWDVWWDVSLTPGAHFRSKIAEQLGLARCIVVLWSVKSIQSDWVIDEAQEGKDRGVLVQALIDDVRPPHGFRQIQTADLVKGSRGESEEFDRLCAGVSSVAGPPSRKADPTPPARIKGGQLSRMHDAAAGLGVRIFALEEDPDAEKAFEAFRRTHPNAYFATRSGKSTWRIHRLSCSSLAFNGDQRLTASPKVCALTAEELREWGRRFRVVTIECARCRDLKPDALRSS